MLQRADSDGPRKDLVNLLGMRQRSASLLMRYRERIAANFDDFLGRRQLCRFRPDAGPGRRGRTRIPPGRTAAQRIDRPPLSGAARDCWTCVSRRSPRRLARRQAPIRSAPLAWLAPSCVRSTMPTCRKRCSRCCSASTNTNCRRSLATCTASSMASLRPADSMRAGDAESVQRPASPRPTAPEPCHGPGAGERVAASSNPGIDLFRISAEARVQHQRLRDLLHIWRDTRIGRPGTAASSDPTGRANCARRNCRPSPHCCSGTGASASKRRCPAMANLHAAIRSQLFEGARSLGLDPEQTATGRTRGGRDRHGRPDVRIAARNPCAGRPGTRSCSRAW